MKKLLTICLFFVFIICLTGCNKTGIKGTIVYAPTSMPLEDVEVSAIPRIDTEERNSLTKSGKTDKNGEYKITGLDQEYTYQLVIKSNKFRDCYKSPMVVGFLTKNQTKLIDKPITVFDVLPGVGCYVKRDNGKFEEIQKFKKLSTIQFIGTFRLIDDGNAIHSSTRDPNFYYTSEDEIKGFNPTKIKNGEIIYFNIESEGSSSIQYWHISPVGKIKYSEDSKLEVENIGLNNVLVAGIIELGKFSDYYYGNTMSLIRNNITKKSTASEKYYQVNLSPGYYIASSYDFTDKSNTRNQPVLNFIIEIVDNPIEEGD